MQKPSAHELTVMEAIWDVWKGEGPVLTKSFVPILKEKGWKPGAHFPYLYQLEKKGYVRSEPSPTSKRENIYFPLVSRQEYLQEQSVHFINKVGLRPFLSALVNDPDLSEEVITAMQELLDEHKK